MGGSTLYVEAARVDAGEGKGVLRTTGACLGSCIISTLSLLSPFIKQHCTACSFSLAPFGQTYCTVVVFSCRACN